MTTNIHAAFAAAYQQVENVKKNATNPHFQSAYANLEAVLEEVKPACEAQNLVYLQPAISYEWGAGCKTLVRDESGAELDFGELILPYPKRDPQGAGSCISYARRYATKGVFSLAETDDDGEAASRVEKPKPANPLKADWEKVKKAYKGDTDRRASVLEYLGGPASEDEALAAFCALGEAERVAVWTLANGGEVS